MNAARIGRGVVIAVILAIVALPIYWMVAASLKSNKEITQDATLYPHVWTFDNYLRLFSELSARVGAATILFGAKADEGLLRAVAKESRVPLQVSTGSPMSSASFAVVPALYGEVSRNRSA